MNAIMQFFSTADHPAGQGAFRFWIYSLFPDVDGLAARKAQPLYYAASYGLVAVVAYMLHMSYTGMTPTIDLEPKSGRYESSALQVAIYGDHLEVVKILLAAGANPNSTDADGLDCMYWAESNGNVECMELLRWHIASQVRGRPLLTLPTSSPPLGCAVGRPLLYRSQTALRGSFSPPSPLQHGSSPSASYYQGWKGVHLPYESRRRQSSCHTSDDEID